MIDSFEQILGIALVIGGDQGVFVGEGGGVDSKPVEDGTGHPVVLKSEGGAGRVYPVDQCIGEVGGVLLQGYRRAVDAHTGELAAGDRHVTGGKVSQCLADSLHRPVDLVVKGGAR